MYRSIRLMSILLGLLTLAMTVTAGAQAASAPAPGWRITMIPQPSNFTSARNAECEAMIEIESPYMAAEPAKACDRFLVSVRNEGTEPSEEGSPVAVSAVLPPGLTLVGLSKAEGKAGGYPSYEGLLPPLDCDIATVTCTLDSTLEPEEAMAMTVLVTVDPSAEGKTLSASALVEGGGAPAASVSAQVSVSSTRSAFSLDGLALDPLGLNGLTDSEAGGHPNAVTTSFTIPTFKSLKYTHVEDPKNIVFDLPLGLVGNPQSLPTCPEQLVRNAQCPANTQVGRIGLEINEEGGTAATETFALWNVTPQRGYAAEFGAEYTSRDFFLYADVVHTASGYHLRVSSPGIVHLAEVYSLTGVQVTFWGDPAARNGSGGSGETTPFFSNPADCSAGAIPTTAWAVSWQQPDRVVRAEYPSYPDGVTACNQLAFAPTFTSRPSTNRADNPSGLNFDLDVPQASGMTDPATPPLRTVTVALPKGMPINPSSADGLASCNPEGPEGINVGSDDISVRGQDLGDPEATEYGAGHPGGNESSYDDGLWHTAPGHCPDASQIGTLEVITPLLDHPLPGKLFLGTPECSPCGNADAASGKLIKLFMEINDRKSGVVIKLPGVVRVDPGSGQLTATFRDLPQLPFSKLHLQLNEGGRAPLRTPAVCMGYETTSNLTPWSSPETPDARPSDTFAISNAAGSGPCPGSEGQQPNAPSFTAGTLNPSAGAYSPFVFKAAREDGTQEFGSLEATLPKGLLGKIAGIPYCSEASIAAAGGTSGRAERTSPSCSFASEVGTVTVGAGAGPNPYYVQGHVYLAGPYKDAPLSLAIITPAVAGPFDLGTVVVRTALNVDPETAQVRAVSDPLPTVLAGIPLDIRSVVVALARPQFIFNPTSCDPTSVTGSLASTLGGVAPLSQHFQVGGCNRLKYKPRVKLKLEGATRRSGHPSLRAIVTAPQGAYANTGRIQVGLPHAEFLDQSNIGKVCTQPELKSATCPAHSVYGHVKVWTPLFDAPLEGNVYLGVGYGHNLPDLVAELNGQVRLLVHGKVDTTKHAGLRNTFEVVPDAPFSKIVFELKGGKKYGLLQNSENLCKKKHRASARFVAQNGLVSQLHPKIANSCKDAVKKKNKRDKRSKELKDSAKKKH